MDHTLVKHIEAEKKFANAVFKTFREIKFGITPCCLYDLESIIIKKELCDWQSLDCKDVKDNSHEVTNSQSGVCEVPRSSFVETSVFEQVLLTLQEIQNQVDEKDLNFKFVQATASNQWTIVHNLNKFPSVRIEDPYNNDIIGQVDYINSNALTVFFDVSVSGIAYLN